MSRIFQRLLLALGVLALLALVAEIGLSLGATTHGNAPARVVQINAGPYPLTVSLYKEPALAGFALPFAIAPQQPSEGKLTFDVSSMPDYGLHATPVHASLSPDPKVSGAVQGTAEITVQGSWSLAITVNGPQGSATVSVPIEATAPPAIPDWLGWLIGCIPIYGLLIFLLTQRARKKTQQRALVA